MVGGDRGLGTQEYTLYGAGSLREAGKERLGNRIPKVAGTRRNREKLLQSFVIFCNRKNTRGRNH